ncbi:hypothetical protein COLO4_22745 [Corchorus olitorius]|uniref:Uncharacterized protein n=1 Tax=Corchorus olitorius TaxID=93759 RepID=A0A1R3IK65_9ROSI|nr:hypothetical protein COLO4_22745 [Corchorus olitorius]
MRMSVLPLLRRSQWGRKCGREVVEDDKNKLRWQRRELARDLIRSIVFAVYLEFNDLVLAVDTALKLILMPMCQNAIFTVTRCQSLYLILLGSAILFLF